MATQVIRPDQVSGGVGNQPIADTLLGSSATNITFSSIAGTFKHLQLEFFARGDGAVSNDSVLIQCNGDSTSGHYAYQYMNALNTTLAGGSSTTATSIQGPYLPGASAGAGISGGSRIEFHNYADTSGSMGRPCHTIGGIGKNLAMLVSVGYFNDGSNSPITSIKLSPGTSTNFVTGSRASLYGTN